MLNGQRVRVACQVEPYSLSAHADGGELAGIGSEVETAYLFSGTRRCRGARRVVFDGGCLFARGRAIAGKWRCIYGGDNGGDATTRLWSGAFCERVLQAEDR